MKKLTTILFFSFLAFTSRAQFQSIKLGVNGLTCSQCSRTVEMSIRKLPFVADVKMNLEHTEGEVVLKDGEHIDVQKIAKAVVNAGFSVRYMEGEYQFDHKAVKANECTDINGSRFVFVKSPGQALNGKVKLTFLGSQYQAKKEYKKWQPLLTSNCTDGTTPYYVTIDSK